MVSGSDPLEQSDLVSANMQHAQVFGQAYYHGCLEEVVRISVQFKAPFSSVFTFTILLRLGLGDYPIKESEKSAIFTNTQHIIGRQNTGHSRGLQVRLTPHARPHHASPESFHPNTMPKDAKSLVASGERLH